MLKYKCLVFDHDDTVVKTTADIHYPSFKKTIEAVRPGLVITKEEFMLNCFDPGFYVYMEQKLGFNIEEMKYQLNSWLEFINSKVPSVYDGIEEVILKQKELGGLVCVVSHSYSDIIKRDYIESFNMLPDAIYGGDEDADKRKPSTFPLEDICTRFNLNKEDIVVIDDLKPGYDMALNFGVDFVCAGWSHELEQVKRFMKENCKVYLESSTELKDVVFK